MQSKETTASLNTEGNRDMSHTNIKTYTIFGMFFVILMASANINAGEKALFSVFSPKTSTWYSNSADAKQAFSKTPAVSSTDVLVPADYDGDGIIDFGVWTPETGIWSIKRSSDNQAFSIYWGTTTVRSAVSIKDIPVPADYDGDGKADIAVWRPETGTWLVLFSSKNYDGTKSEIFSLGKSGDVPVPADYDGDKRADFAIFRTKGNQWLISDSKTNAVRTEKFGDAATDLFVPADYTGDGKADIAVYRRDTWLVLNSETSETEPFYMGFADAAPVPADYDGDGIIDFAVFRKGTWFIYESSQPRFKTFTFGGENDVPLNSISRS
ncbi:MAG: VCBS repeat-containing protein [Pyrinomonadaceae bacterium]